MTNDNEGNDDETPSERTRAVDVSEVSSDSDGRPSSDGDEAYRSTGDETASEGLSRSDWESLPANPDPMEDLGYRIAAWECFHTADNTNQIIYMPDDESLLKEDAFIVAEEDVLCEVSDRC